MRQNPRRTPPTSDARPSTKTKAMDNAERKEVIYYSHPDFKFLDDEERELIEWVESTEWRPIENQEAAKDYFQKVAQNTLERLEREKNAAKPAQDAAD